MIAKMREIESKMEVKDRETEAKIREIEAKKAAEDRDLRVKRRDAARVCQELPAEFVRPRDGYVIFLDGYLIFTFSAGRAGHPPSTFLLLP